VEVVVQVLSGGPRKDHAAPNYLPVFNIPSAHRFKFAFVQPTGYNGSAPEFKVFAPTTLPPASTCNYSSPQLDVTSRCTVRRVDCLSAFRSNSCSYRNQFIYDAAQESSRFLGIGQSARGVKIVLILWSSEDVHFTWIFQTIDGENLDRWSDQSDQFGVESNGALISFNAIDMKTNLLKSAWIVWSNFL